MDDKNTTDVVYLDFAKAFESVNLVFLLAKLESFGLCGKVGRWIKSNLTERTYKVQVALSQETKINSGLPQRSVIGPIIFLLFANDLPSVINVTMLFFADDVKMVLPRDLLQGSL